MNIFWIYLNKLSYSDFFSEITELKKYIIFTPNPEILLKAKKDKNFRDTLNKADYLIPDWIGLYIAYQIIDFKLRILKFFINIFLMPYYIFNIFFRRKYLYRKYWDKICWSDLTFDLLDFASKNNVKITIVDLYNPTDKKKVKSQKNFKKSLSKKFPNLNFDYFIYNPRKKQKIIKDISNSKSNILFSTLWMKTQEESIIEIMSESKNIKLWLGIWSSFDYITWFQKRAPKFFRTLWFEWFYRIFTWTQKLKRIKRIYNAIFVFIWQVLIYK